MYSGLAASAEQLLRITTMKPFFTLLALICFVVLMITTPVSIGFFLYLWGSTGAAIAYSAWTAFKLWALLGLSGFIGFILFGTLAKD